MSKKKVNPRRRPATWADVEKATEIATMKALATVEAIFLTVLLDKFNGADYIRDIWKEVNKLSDEIKEGRVNLFDLMEVLRDEYNIEISQTK